PSLLGSSHSCVVLGQDKDAKGLSRHALLPSRISFLTASLLLPFPRPTATPSPLGMLHLCRHTRALPVKKGLGTFPLLSQVSIPRSSPLVPLDQGLMSTWLPTPRSQRPPLWTASGFRSSIREWKGWMHSTLALAYARWEERKDGFSPSKFRYDAKEIYKAMNTSFAEGDLATLRYVCGNSQYSRLKNEIKRRPKGRLVWTMHEEVTPPRIMAAYIGSLADKLLLFQIVVRLHTKQSVALYDEYDRLINGDPNKPQAIEEYVVFEKMSNDNTPWRVYGKTSLPQVNSRKP
ncbi:Tim44-like domain-containing protein, partial [Piptocephalis cylindrospora]